MVTIIDYQTYLEFVVCIREDDRINSRINFQEQKRKLFFLLDSRQQTMRRRVFLRQPAAIVDGNTEAEGEKPSEGIESIVQGNTEGRSGGYRKEERYRAGTILHVITRQIKWKKSLDGRCRSDWPYKFH